jgi:hypothetical protein
METQVGVALTMSEAARACRVHRSTIRRHLVRRSFPNAYKEAANGWWRIPVADLEAAGLRPNRMAPPEEADARGDAPELHEELERLRRELSEAQMRAAAAEAIARERLERIGDLRMAFRALQAGPAAVPAESDVADVADEPVRAEPVRRVPGTRQSITVKDLSQQAPQKDPDLLSLAMDAYKVFTPWRRRRD